MPTVVDELIVKLGLDSSGFSKGQKDASSAFAKTKDSAVASGKAIEDSSKKAADSINRVAHEAMALFAIFTAGRGIKEFISDLTASDAALGRLAANLNLTPGYLSAFEMAVERNGGTAAGAAGSFKSLSNAIQELRTGGSTAILDPLGKIQASAAKFGGVRFNLGGPIKQTMLDLATNLHAIYERDPVLAMFLGGKAGVDEGTLNLLVKGPKAYAAALEESRKIGLVSPEQVKAAQDLQHAWVALTQASENLGRTVFTDLAPAFVQILDGMQQWIEANHDWLSSEITGDVKEFSTWIKSVDWNGVGTGIKGFASDANSIAQSLGGWKTAAEAFFLIWAGSNFLRVLSALGALRALLGLPAINLPAAFAAATVGGAVAAGVETEAALNSGSYQVDPNTGGLVRVPEGQGYKEPEGGSGFGALGRWWKAHAPTMLGGSPKGASLGDAASHSGNLTRNQREAYAAAISQGYTDTAARALVANFSGEALNKPGDYHWDVSHYSQGIGQWDPTRAARIKEQFGQEPRFMSVADQTKAAIWEIRNRPEYGATKNALEAGDNASAMIGALVRNYERPRDQVGEIGKRSKIYAGLPGLGGDAAAANWSSVSAAVANANRAAPSSIQGLSFGAPGAARISNDNRATSSTSTSSSEVSIGNVTIHTSATDATGIAKDIKPAIERNSFTAQANTGQM